MSNGGSMEAWRRCMTLVECCTNMSRLKTIHALFITNGLSSNSFAMSKLLSFCALSDSGDLNYASFLFAHTPSPNSFFYNTLIRAYSRSSQPHLALHFFNLMLRDRNLVVDEHTFPHVLTSCAKGFWVSEGAKVHNLVLKKGLDLGNHHVQTALLRFYCGCKLMNCALKAFDEVPQPDLIQLNVIMSGYVKCGLAAEALGIFRNMLVTGVEPDEFCLTTALSGCAQLGALWQGRWIHECIKRRKMLVSDVFLGTALVDMYAKCGCIDMAFKVFEGMPHRNLFSWAAFIGALALHGYAQDAIYCLNRMLTEDQLRPDGVVLLEVLMACTHAGRYRDGLFLLENMEAKYSVVPKHEHYSCVVDMLCKAGKLYDALEITSRMPMRPLASIWGALLSGCRLHKNVELAELAVKELELLGDIDGSDDDGAYVQLYNIYLAIKKHDKASEIRRIIGEKGIKKSPGYSMIEVEGQGQVFVSGDAAHQSLPHIHDMLKTLSYDLQASDQDTVY